MFEKILRNSEEIFEEVRKLLRKSEKYFNQGYRRSKTDFSIYLLRWKRSSTSVAFGLAGNETFGNENQFAAVLAVPYNSNVMPLTVVYSRVFSEWKIHVLDVMEERDLNAVAVGLDHWSTIRRYVRRTHTVQREEYSSFVFLSKLNPESDGQALLATGKEWNDLGRTAARWIGKVHVVVYLYSWK